MVKFQKKRENMVWNEKFNSNFLHLYYYVDLHNSFSLGKTDARRTDAEYTDG